MIAQLSVLERVRRLRASAAAPTTPDTTVSSAIAEHPAVADTDAHAPGPQESWMRQQVRSVLYLVAGVFSAALGLEAFILPNGLFDGGVTGISLLSARLIHLPLSVFLVVLNLPFIYLGYKQLGKDFAFRALAAILALAIVLEVVHFPVVTQDKMLIAVFGGFFLGAGIGLAMRGGGVLDGTEILAVYLTRKHPAAVGVIVSTMNVPIFREPAGLL